MQNRPNFLLKSEGQFAGPRRVVPPLATKHVSPLIGDASRLESPSKLPSLAQRDTNNNRSSSKALFIPLDRSLLSQNTNVNNQVNVNHQHGNNNSNSNNNNVNTTSASMLPFSLLNASLLQAESANVFTEPDSLSPTNHGTVGKSINYGAIRGHMRNNSNQGDRILPSDIAERRELRQISKENTYNIMVLMGQLKGVLENYEPGSRKVSRIVCKIMERLST
jgi:hypothetical protein